MTDSNLTSLGNADPKILTSRSIWRNAVSVLKDDRLIIVKEIEEIFNNVDSSVTRSVPCTHVESR